MDIRITPGDVLQLHSLLTVLKSTSNCISNHERPHLIDMGCLYADNSLQTTRMHLNNMSTSIQDRLALTQPRQPRRVHQCKAHLVASPVGRRLKRARDVDQAGVDDVPPQAQQRPTLSCQELGQLGAAPTRVHQQLARKRLAVPQLHAYRATQIVRRKRLTSRTCSHKTRACLQLETAMQCCAAPAHSA